MEASTIDIKNASKKYWIPYGAIEYIYSMNMDEIRSFYRDLKNMIMHKTSSQFHIKRKINFIKDTFPVNSALKMELWEEF